MFAKQVAGRIGWGIAAEYPATVEVTRTVADNAAVAFRGNAYSVPPGHLVRQVVDQPTRAESVTEFRLHNGW